jgi:putative ABC transport system permease protein
VDDAMALPGVLRAEGAFALPVRLRAGTTARLAAIEVRDPGATLSRVLDLSGRPVAVPPEGVMLPALLANRLGVGPGDLITVEFLTPPRETHLLPVTGISQQRMGETVHMHPDALFSLLRHGPRVNRIDLLVDEGRIDDLYAAVKDRPGVAGIALFLEVQRQFREQMDENLLTVVFIYSALGVLITVGVVYNAARIQLAERAYELATLRVLGFSRGEVGGILVGEIMLLTLLAVPVGWLAGYGFAWVTATGMSSDIIAIPFIVGRQTYAWATILVVVSALVSVLMVRRRLDRVDLVSALKQQG